ncbi:MAG: membrane protein insertase YidC [Streptosporangiaceae bacterium]|nr:membrane protein insertase YidC [Streptosporangiaceae bacterium]
MLSIFGVPVDAAYHLVAWITIALAPAFGGLAAAAAIIAVTVAARIILMPLSIRAVRGQAAQARLAPRLQALRARYGGQPDRLRREITALYQQEGTSMLAGVAPALLQWPLLSVMYLLFRSPRVGGRPNTLLSHHLLGVPLGARWLTAVPWSLPAAHSAVFLGVLALLAGLCWLSGRLSRLMAARAAAAAPGGTLARVLPYLTVVIAACAPLAAGIYLLVGTAWSLAERRLFGR